MLIKQARQKHVFLFLYIFTMKALPLFAEDFSHDIRSLLWELQMKPPALLSLLARRRACAPCVLLTDACRSVSTRRRVITWPKPRWPCRTGSRSWRRPTTSLRGTLCFWALRRWRTGWSSCGRKEGDEVQRGSRGLKEILMSREIVFTLLWWPMRAKKRSSQGFGRKPIS